MTPVALLFLAVSMSADAFAASISKGAELSKPRFHHAIGIGLVFGIIEAMKIMNEITADYAGVIVESLVQNAQPVEYGSPLLRVVPADDLE